MRRQTTAAARSTALLAAFLVAAVLATACAAPPPGGEPIDREVFIETYVELRLAAIDSDEFAVTSEQREEILARQGVDAERLLHFAEVHGTDTEFMNEVWAEVEQRLQDRREAEEAGG